MDRFCPLPYVKTGIRQQVCYLEIKFEGKLPNLLFVKYDKRSLLYAGVRV